MLQKRQKFGWQAYSPAEGKQAEQIGSGPKTRAAIVVKYPGKPGPLSLVIGCVWHRAFAR